MEEIVIVNGQQYRLSLSAPLTQAQRNEVIRQLSTQTSGCSSCGETNSNLNNRIKTLAKTCTRVTANIGDKVTVTTKGTGGVANYTAYFLQSNGSGVMSPTNVTGLGEGVSGTSTYTVVAGDAGKIINFSSFVKDSCGAGTTSFTETCSVEIVTCTATTSTTISITSPAISCGDSVVAGTSVTFKGVNTGGSGSGNWIFELLKSSAPSTVIESITSTTISATFTPIKFDQSGTYNYFVRSKATCETSFVSSADCSLTVTPVCVVPTVNMTVT